MRDSRNHWVPWTSWEQDDHSVQTSSTVALPAVLVPALQAAQKLLGFQQSPLSSQSSLLKELWSILARMPLLLSLAFAGTPWPSVSLIGLWDSFPSAETTQTITCSTFLSQLDHSHTQVLLLDSLTSTRIICHDWVTARSLLAGWTELTEMTIV